MLKKYVLPISYLGTLVFLTALLAFGCSPFLMGYVGVCAVIFSVGAVSCAFVFVISFVSRSSGNEKWMIWVFAWILFLIGYFVELRHILAHLCLR